MLNKHFKTFSICILLLISVSAYSQYSADPYSRIYDDINYWHGRGFIFHMPSFQPLPEVVLVSLLNEVITNGDDASIKKAKRYLREINKLIIYATVSAFGRINTQIYEDSSPDTNQMYANGTLEGAGAYRITDLISVSGAFGGHALGKKDSEHIFSLSQNHFSNRSLNRVEELEEIKVGTISSIDAEISFSNRTSFAVGREDIFLHAGFMRRSIGPHYDDGILVSPRSPQSANLFVYWKGKKKNLAVTWGLFALSSEQLFTQFSYDRDATTGEVSNIVSSRSTKNKINKFFYFNSLTWFVNKNIELSIYEAVMFGNFNIGYLIPIKMIYAVDSRSDFAAGNLFAGFLANFRARRNLTFPFSFLVDDVNVKSLIKFNFYTKIKFAGEVAIKWNPDSNYLRELKLGYQIVSPYTYTHTPTSSNDLYSTAYNTENHTHLGTHFATSLEPSSHRIYLSTDITPFPFLTIGLHTKVEQHSNPSEGILGGPLNNGSIYDDGYKSVYDRDDETETEITFQERFDFLQGTVETKIETGINLGFIYPIARAINVFTDINYSYEYTMFHEFTSDVKHHGIFQVEMGIIFANFIKTKK